MSMGMVNKDTAATIPAAGNTGDKVGNLAALHTTVKSDIVAAVNEVKDEQANKADMDIVADAFSAAETYAEGDYCTYEGGLYKFKTSHSGAWDAADVDQIKIAGELSELKNTLNSYTYHTISASDITERNSSISSIAVSYVRWGKLCILYLEYMVTANINAWTKLFKIPIDGVIPEINPSHGPLEYMGTSGTVMSHSTIPAGAHYDQIVYICK